MSTPVFDIGDGIRATAEFLNLDDVATDPTSIVFRVRDPLGVVTTPNVVKVSTGNYYAEFTVTLRGTWTYRWEGTGIVIAAEEGRITVRASAFY